jgi:NNP family nitrate/nitrite transporter-like MFS transporter
VLRPSLLSPVTRHAAGRNLALDITVALGIGVTMSLVGAILPTVARLGGMDPVGLSALAAAPFLANLLGAFAGRVGPRSAAQLSLMRGVGASALLALFLVPTALMAVLASAVFWVSYALSGPYHFRLWGAMYPARSLGRVMGVLGMTRAGAGAAAAIGGGILADRIGGSQAVALVGLIGVGCTLAYAGFRAKTDMTPPRYSARESVRALLDQPHLLRLIVAQLFYGGGLIAASPLFALVYVDRLHLSVADVGLVGVLTAVANTLTYPLWGAFADRRGGSRTLALGSAVGAGSVVAYAIAPNVVVLWIGAVAGGIASGAIDLGINAAVSTETPMATRAAAMAGWNAITGPRGIVAAFLMSILIQLRLVDVTGALLVCAATALVGVVIYARSGPGAAHLGQPIGREPSRPAPAPTSAPARP